MDNNPVFDDAYWLHQPPEVRAMRTMLSEDARTSLAQTLAKRGFIIDRDIMVWAWDAWKVMFMRKLLGYTWTPSWLQSYVPTAPGADNPGTPSYDPNNPPPGSIRVSTDVADFPPFDPPHPASPPPAILTSYVGSYQGGGVYASLSGDPSKDGDIVGDPRGQFLKHKILSAFGYAQWYTVLGA